MRRAIILGYQGLGDIKHLSGVLAKYGYEESIAIVDLSLSTYFQLAFLTHFLSRFELEFLAKRIPSWIGEFPRPLLQLLAHSPSE